MNLKMIDHIGNWKHMNLACELGIEDCGILLIGSGLYDKNGNELFEDDLFQYNEHAGYLMQSFKGRVYYNASQACWGYKSVMCVSGSDRFHPFCSIDELQEDFLNYVEKIGNKWE